MEKKNVDKILNLVQVNRENGEAPYLNNCVLVPLPDNVDNDKVYLEIITPKKNRIDYTEKLPNEETRNFMKKLQKELKISQSAMKEIIGKVNKSIKKVETIEKQIGILCETAENVLNKKQIEDDVKQVHKNCER